MTNKISLCLGLLLPLCQDFMEKEGTLSVVPEEGRENNQSYLLWEEKYAEEIKSDEQ